jgi:hypothetical protein
MSLFFMDLARSPFSSGRPTCAPPLFPPRTRCHTARLHRLRVLPTARPPSLRLATWHITGVLPPSPSLSYASPPSPCCPPIFPSVSAQRSHRAPIAVFPSSHKLPPIRGTWQPSHPSMSRVSSLGDRSIATIAGFTPNRRHRFHPW